MEAGKTAVLASSVCKAYLIGDENVEVLKGVNLEVKTGEFVIIQGPSGSGKTTLLNLIGSIDKPTSGKLVVFDNDLGCPVGCARTEFDNERRHAEGARLIP